jgi:ADP-ribose pyrophosphatase YjhB (NUDIX family)
MKKTKESISLVITDDNDNFLAVKRANDPTDDLANVWGFPAISLKEGETHLEGAIRVGKQKLGIDIELGEKIGDSTHDRDDYIIHLTDYKAKITKGVPTAPQGDISVSQYSECKFSNDPTILFEAASKGSLCTQLYLQSIGADWRL